MFSTLTFLTISSAYTVVYNGAYCSQYGNLQTQLGVYTGSTDYGDQCASES